MNKFKTLSSQLWLINKPKAPLSKTQIQMLLATAGIMASRGTRR